MKPSPSNSTRRVIAAMRRSGWQFKRRIMETRSRVVVDFPGTLTIGVALPLPKAMLRVFAKDGVPDFVLTIPDKTQIGPVMLARIAKHTGIATEAL